MDKPTNSQLLRIRTAADLAYGRIGKTLDFDPDLTKADAIGLSDFISRAQGALLDLTAAINAQLQKHTDDR